MYALIRGRKWVSAPQGFEPGQLIPPVLAICDDDTYAWLFPDLDVALNRRDLLRLCWGWNTEVRAIR